MGKILFLADIHGNMTAVEALEKEIERIQPDDIWFLGDAVGKGPENDKAIDWVRSHCKHFIKGNWDEYVCNGYRNGVWSQNDFYWRQIGEERIKWLESLPYEDEVLISGQWFRLLHGRPVDRLYHAYDDFETLMMGFKSRVSDREYNGYICADSHMPYFRACKLGYAMNTGSVGNSIGIPNVHALILEGEIEMGKKSAIRYEILSIPYDNQAAADVAERYPELPDRECYQREVLTGIYSR